MRRFNLLVLFFLLYFLQVSSQNVYVTLSAEIDSTSLKSQPIKTNFSLYRLKITYENKTDSAIYFDKVIKDVQMNDGIGIPQFKGSGLYNPPKINFSKIDYSKDTIVVVVSSSVNGKWDIFSDHIYTYTPRNSILEEDLEIYYDSLYYNWYPNHSCSFSTELIYETHISGRYNELVNDFIAHHTDSLTKYTDFFVFLKPGEKYSDYFDMSGFVYFKGHYSFMIRRNYWPHSIVVDMRYDDRLKRNIQITEPLPETTGDYMLYKGDIITNVFSIDF